MGIGDGSSGTLLFSSAALSQIDSYAHGIISFGDSVKTGAIDIQSTSVFNYGSTAFISAGDNITIDNAIGIANTTSFSSMGGAITFTALSMDMVVLITCRLMPDQGPLISTRMSVIVQG